MPALPSWSVRIPAILAKLRHPGMPPVLDRPAIEELFGLRRRQAIRLLGATRGYQVGKTFIVDRQSVIDYLEILDRYGAVPEAGARKRSVAHAITEVANYAEAQRVQLPTSPGSLRRIPTDLPASISLVSPGKLQISYSTAEDLLARVVELAAAATNDFPAFRKRYESRQ